MTTYQLTEKQKAQIPAWREKWLKVGRNCDPADFAEAKRGVQMVYQHQAEDDPSIVVPETMIHMRSPNEGAIAAAMLTALSAQTYDRFHTRRRSQITGTRNEKGVLVSLPKRHNTECEMLSPIPTGYRIRFRNDGTECDIQKNELTFGYEILKRQILSAVERVADKYKLTFEEQAALIARLQEAPAPPPRLATAQERALKPSVNVGTRLSRYLVAHHLNK